MNYDLELDKLLKVKTSGRDATKANYMNFPYEATPYKVLQELANSGYITKKDKIVDFGCGKGRVEFFLAYTIKAKMIGVEYDVRLYNVACENKKTAISASRAEFIHCDAKEYIIDDDVTGVYFFNPFSVEILDIVIFNIVKSKNNNDRRIFLYFYYPSKKYLEYLNNNQYITYVDSIDCFKIFDYSDDMEYIAIYKI